MSKKIIIPKRRYIIESSFGKEQVVGILNARKRCKELVSLNINPVLKNEKGIILIHNC